MQIDQQSKKDLEFDVVCDLLSRYCKSDKAKELAKNLKFLNDGDAVADGDDDVMSMNGTTQGGLIDSYIEVTATTRGWLCSKSIPLGSGNLITPFS